MQTADMGALASAMWVSGPDFDYGPDDAGYYADHHNHIVHGTFDLGPDQCAGARLLVASLGYRVVWVNGKRLNDEVLSGDWTRYDRAVYYDAYDITDLLAPGQNTIQVELGNGWYNPSPLTLFGKYNLRQRLAEVGTPQVLLTVLNNAGQVLCRSDASWTWTEGQLTFNNVYLGEHRDLSFVSTGRGAVTVRHNTRQLLPAVVERCRMLGREEATSVVEQDGALLVDIGHTVAGFADMTFRAHVGQRVTVTYAEGMDAQGRPVYDTNLAGMVGLATPRGTCPGGSGAPELALERDVITAAEGLNHFVNEFCWHSFRYTVVEGLEAGDLVSFAGAYVHTDLRTTGTLVTDNPFYQDLLDAAKRTKLNNVHGIWEDCARERLGYGGDMVALFSSNAFLFDVSGLLDKTLADFRCDQTDRGGLPETAPFMGIGSQGPAYGEGPLLWQLAYPYLALGADRWYGRADLLRREWPYLRRFASYLMSFDPADLAGHCLGDHSSIESAGFGSTPDKGFCGWCAILWSLECVAEIARRLGQRHEDLDQATQELHSQIVVRFGHHDGSFGQRSQTSYAFAAGLRLGDSRALTQGLAERIRGNDGVLATGIFGTMLAFDQLNRHGMDDVVEGWLLREGDPSFHAMLASGSGTLAEEFHVFLDSLDHAMFSSYVQWMSQALGGIRVADDAVAADHLIIRPYFSAHTNKVACTYHTPRGEAHVSWERAGDTIRLDLTIPAGTRIDLCLNEETRTLGKH